MIKLKTICLIVIFLFSLFGMLVFMNLIHELSHKQDYKGFAINGSEYLCMLSVPFKDSPAFYSFDYKEKDKGSIQTISKFTEIKAVLISILVAVLFIVCYMIIIKDYYST